MGKDLQWNNQAMKGIGASENHAHLLYDSYLRLIGRPMIEWDGNQPLWSMLFEAPFMLLSHGTEEDPILNFGNRRTLTLWEMDWVTLTKTPSRLTAEPVLQEKRNEFLKQVQEKGYVSNYSGIRISQTGKRFEIMDVIVWNVIDRDGVFHGQAAMFEQVKHL